MNEFSMKFIADFVKMSEEEVFESQDREDLWSSLQWLEVVFSIEEEFDIQFDSDELNSLKTPRKLCEAVRKHLAARGDDTVSMI